MKRMPLSKNKEIRIWKGRELNFHELYEKCEICNRGMMRKDMLASDEPSEWYKFYCSEKCLMVDLI